MFNIFNFPLFTKKNINKTKNSIQNCYSNTNPTSDNCLLSNNIYDYHIVSQGKVTVASIDDAEEFILTDVISQYFFFVFKEISIFFVDLCILPT